jgi:hypothetical protein
MSFDENITKIGNLSKAIAIGVGILILTSFVAVYGMNTFLDRPEYDKFCPDIYDIKIESECVNAGGEWTNYTNDKEEIRPVGSCSRPKACYEEYNSLRKDYSMKVFFAAIPLGLLIIVFGTFVFSLSSVGVGMILGGIYTLIYGAANYWQYGEDWARFLISFVGLVALVIIAYRFKKKR